MACWSFGNNKKTLFWLRLRSFATDMFFKVLKLKKFFCLHLAMKNK